MNTANRPHIVIPLLLFFSSWPQTSAQEKQLTDNPKTLSERAVTTTSQQDTRFNTVETSTEVNVQVVARLVTALQALQKESEKQREQSRRLEKYAKELASEVEELRLQMGVMQRALDRSSELSSIVIDKVWDLKQKVDKEEPPKAK